MESNVTTIDLKNARTLRNEVLNEIQFKQRIKILYNLQEDLEENSEKLKAVDSRELQDLIRIEKEFKAGKLEDVIVNVHRLNDDSSYYQIKFPKSVATLVKGDEIIDFINSVPEDIIILETRVKQNKSLSENNEQVARRIQSGEVEKFSVEKIGDDLMNAAMLLNVARLACRGFPCANIVVQSLSKYQNLILETNITLDVVLANCLMSLTFHKKALNDILEGDLISALNKFEASNELALKSLEVVKLRKTESQSLALFIQDAIKNVSIDESITNQQKIENQKQKENLQAMQANYQTQKDELEKLITQSKQQEKEMWDQMQEMSNKVLALGIVKAVAEPLTKAGLAACSPGAAIAGEASSSFSAVAKNFAGEINNQLKSEEESLGKIKKELSSTKEAIKLKETKLKAEEAGSEAYKKLEAEIDELKIEKAGLEEEVQSKSSAFAQLNKELGKSQDSLQKMIEGHQECLAKCKENRYGLEKQQVKILSDLQETLVRIQNSNTQENSLNLALDCLHAGTVTLNRVANIFDNFIRFWAMQVILFEQILTLAGIKDNTSTEKLLSKLKESFLRWLALTGINHVAKMQISSVSNKIHEIQNHIPNIEDGHKQAKKFSEKAREYIEKEMQELDLNNK